MRPDSASNRCQRECRQFKSVHPLSKKRPSRSETGVFLLNGDTFGGLIEWGSGKNVIRGRLHSSTCGIVEELNLFHFGM